MITVTSDLIPGKRIVKTFGLVRGNTIRARHVGSIPSLWLNHVNRQLTG